MFGALVTLRGVVGDVWRGAWCRIAPTAMIFIPCRNGWSHRPDEFSSAKDIGNGVTVLALTMAELSGGTWGAKDEL